MNDGKYTLLIVEGKREKKILDEVIKEFLSDSTRILTLPMGGNIYTLKTRLKLDERTNLIEALKDYNFDSAFDDAKEQLKDLDSEDISDIYLFFDYDLQQVHGDIKALDEIASDLLRTYSDEFELGKLYINYPAIESVRDWDKETCDTVSNCIVQYENYKDYPYVSSRNDELTNISKYTQLSLWGKWLENFVMRVSCLFDSDTMFGYDEYKRKVTPEEIYKIQSADFLSRKEFFVLSAIPEFLLDYFREDFWLRYNLCPRGEYRGSCNKEIKRQQKKQIKTAIAKSRPSSTT